MPLPTGSHAQETKELQALYDEYCKIAFTKILEEQSKNNVSYIESAQSIAEAAHVLASAMMEERKK